MKKVLGLLGAFLLMFTLAACSSDDTYSEDDVLAVVNGEEVLAGEWLDTVERTKESYAQQGATFEGDEGAMMLEQIEVSVLDQLIQQTVVMQAVQEANITIDEDKLLEEFEAVKGQFQTEALYEEALEESNMSEEDLLELLRNDMKMEAYFDERIETVEITDEEKEAFYQEYKEMSELQGQEIDDYETLEDIIEAHLIQTYEQEQMQAILADLMDDSVIENFLARNDN